MTEHVNVLTQEDHTQINWLSRADITSLLENIGLVCYDSETIEELKEALVVSIEDGTIDCEDIHMGN